MKSAGKAHPAPPQGRHGILKIGMALGVGTGTVQRVVMEQPRPFGVGASARGATDTRGSYRPIGSRTFGDDRLGSIGGKSVINRAWSWPRCGNGLPHFFANAHCQCGSPYWASVIG
jgi:hypothetical protein